MKHLLLPLAMLLFFTACASTQVPPPKTAAFYLEEGESFFEEGLYDDAIAAWEKVRDSYYSPELNILAEQKIAEAYYLAERYTEAAAAYEDFLKQHPSHEEAPKVHYQLGMSYYLQRLSRDRDQTATRNALATFEALLRQYPQAPQAEEVKELASRCRDLLADHEMYVGEFYLRTKRYQAAVGRLEALFTSYPNFYDRDQAYFFLGKAHLMAQNRPKAAEAFNDLFKEFPDSEFILPAQKLLEKHY